MKKLTDLRNLIQHISNFGAIGVVVKVVVVVCLSLAASQVSTFYSAWTLLIIITGIIYALIELFSYGFYQKFPESLVECVENDIKSDAFKKNYARTTIINKAVSDCLIALNGQTCILSGEEYYDENGEIDKSLCDSGLENGLQLLLDPLVNSVQQITETYNIKTTIACFLSDIPQDLRNDETKQTLPYQNELVIIRDDDNKWKTSLLSALTNENIPKGWELNLKQTLERCLMNNRYERQILLKEKETTFITSPIPVVCNEKYVDGCLIIILEGNQSIPEDLNDVLKIFNRIIGNWVSKYRECINKRIKLVDKTIDLENRELLLDNDNSYEFKNKTKLPSEAKLISQLEEN